MAGVKAYQGRHSGQQIDDLLDKVPVLEEKIKEIGSENGDLTYSFSFGSLFVWNVYHNLGKKPSVTIVDENGYEMVGEVEHINNNQLKIRFSRLVSGTVFCN